MRDDAETGGTASGGPARRLVLSAPAHVPDLSDDEALEILSTAVLEPVGRLTQASNLTLLAELHDAAGELTGHRAVYKPVRGERPLHDFPPGTLAAREAAAYLVSRFGGFDLVPPTILRDGPLGVGSVQWWVEQEPERLVDPSGGLVEVLDPSELGPGWLPVVNGEGEDGREVVVVHADDARLRRMAVLDVLLNNADRKAAHLTLDAAGRLRGFDHGVSLHVDDKLRTVLWGWAGQPLDPEELALVEQLVEALSGAGEAVTVQPRGAGVGGEDGTAERALLEDLLATAEVDALLARAQALLESGTFPTPPEARYPLPWPLW